MHRSFACKTLPIICQFYYYDLAGRMIQTIDAAGIRDATAYDDLDRVVATRRGNDGETTFAHDAGDQRTSTTDGDGVITRTLYDNLGSPLRIDVGADDAGGVMSIAAQTHYRYDGRGRMIAMRAGAGDHVDPTYAPTDLTIDAGVVSATAYDPLGRRIESVEGFDVATTYAYDAAGRMTSLTNPLGGTTTWTYDGGLLTTETVDAATYWGGTTDVTTSVARQYHHDIDGDLVQSRDRNGRIIRYRRDGLDHIIGEDWYAAPTGFDPADPTAGAWDVRGASAGGLSFTVDAIGRTTGAAGVDFANAYTFDAAGRMTDADRDILARPYRLDYRW